MNSQIIHCLLTLDTSSNVFHALNIFKLLFYGTCVRFCLLDAATGQRTSDALVSEEGSWSYPLLMELISSDALYLQIDSFVMLSFKFAENAK